MLALFIFAENRMKIPCRLVCICIFQFARLYALATISLGGRGKTLSGLWRLLRRERFRIYHIGVFGIFFSSGSALVCSGTNFVSNKEVNSQAYITVLDCSSGFNPIKVIFV